MPSVERGRIARGGQFPTSGTERIPPNSTPQVQQTPTVRSRRQLVLGCDSVGDQGHESSDRPISPAATCGLPLSRKSIEAAEAAASPSRGLGSWRDAHRSAPGPSFPLAGCVCSIVLRVPPLGPGTLPMPRAIVASVMLDTDRARRRPGTPGGRPSPLQLTAQQDHKLMMESLGIKSLREVRDGMNRTPNAANYDESKVHAFTLPDPLVCKDGTRVTTADTGGTSAGRRSSRTSTARSTAVFRRMSPG